MLANAIAGFFAAASRRRITVADGVVYAGHAKGTCAVQAVDGKILWQNKAWDGGEGTTSTFTVGAGVLVASSPLERAFRT